MFATRYVKRMFTRGPKTAIARTSSAACPQQGRKRKKKGILDDGKKRRSDVKKKKQFCLPEKVSCINRPRQRALSAGRGYQHMGQSIVLLPWTVGVAAAVCRLWAWRHPPTRTRIWS